MRIVLIGFRSFIARHIEAAARARDIACLALGRDAPLAEELCATDTVINFAIDPAYRSGPYVQDRDYDLRAARAARQAGAAFVMLSTRRVYRQGTGWNAIETEGAKGDETTYGQNKARSEATILAESTDRVCIFRLSNIIGYEYNLEKIRGSFFGLLLTSLKQKNKIFFDMHPDTRRDFLPVELCAQAIICHIQQGSAAGVFNLGSGFPTRCGELAHWVMEGFGGGELVCSPMTIKDEFFLNMNKWRADYDLSITLQTLRDYCVRLGQRLQCEKS